jgi:hypothetical protein
MLAHGLTSRTAGGRASRGDESTPNARGAVSACRPGRWSQAQEPHQRRTSSSRPGRGPRSSVKDFRSQEAFWVRQTIGRFSIAREARAPTPGSRVSPAFPPSWDGSTLTPSRSRSISGRALSSLSEREASRPRSSARSASSLARDPCARLVYDVEISRPCITANIIVGETGEGRLSIIDFSLALVRPSAWNLPARWNLRARRAARRARARADPARATSRERPSIPQLPPRRGSTAGVASLKSLSARIRGEAFVSQRNDRSDRPRRRRLPVRRGALVWNLRGRPRCSSRSACPFVVIGEGSALLGGGPPPEVKGAGP